MNGVNKAPSSSEYKPPTPWKKLSADEKIERMRDEVKHLKSQLYRSENVTRRLRELVCTHVHVEGKVMEQVKNYEGGELTGHSEALSFDPEKAFF